MGESAQNQGSRSRRKGGEGKDSGDEHWTGRKSSLRNPYKTQLDASDKVWQLTQEYGEDVGYLGDVQQRLVRHGQEV